VWSRISTAAGLLVAAVILAFAIELLVDEGPGENGANYFFLGVGCLIVLMETARIVYSALVKRRLNRKVESSGG
jgi:hypothetical protein